MNKQLILPALAAALMVALPAAAFAQSTPSNLIVSPTTTGTTVTWYTSDPSASQVSVGPSNSTVMNTVGSTALSTSHSVTIPNLLPGTTYNLQVGDRSVLFVTPDNMYTPVQTGTFPSNTNGGSVTNTGSGVVLGTSTMSNDQEIGNHLTIDNAGTINLMGTVLSTSANTITVQSWVGPWTVMLNSNTSGTAGTTLIPYSSNLSGIQNGDFVEVQGTVNAGIGSGLVIRAQTIQDWTQTNNGQ